MSGDAVMILARAAVLAADRLEPTGRRAGADSGDAQTATRVLHAAGAHEVGVWECTPGGWEVVEREDTETVLVLSGRARLTERGRPPVEIGPGDLVVLPRGWSGRWEILATLRKVFVVA
jgi:uncharacterized protein